MTVYQLVGIVALARGEYLRTHFKNAREVAAALKGPSLHYTLVFMPVSTKIHCGFVLVLNRLEAHEGVQILRRRR